MVLDWCWSPITVMSLRYRRSALNLQALLLLLLSIGIMLFNFLSFLLQPCHVPTSSMSPFQCRGSEEIMGEVTISLNNRATCEWVSIHTNQYHILRSAFMISVSLCGTKPIHIRREIDNIFQCIFVFHCVLYFLWIQHQLNLTHHFLGDCILPWFPGEYSWWSNLTSASVSTQNTLK